jgi:AbrB family looped-hinge helix DNA binding protein
MATRHIRGIPIKPFGHRMKVSSNGQISIPAEIRARWKADRVVVVDMGDYIMVSPISDTTLDELVGKYAGRGPNTDELRREDREEEAEEEERKLGLL